MTATYTDTSQQITSSPSFYSELEAQVLARPYEAEKPDQQLVRHTLNLNSNGYKNIFVRTNDTDVLVLLISYVRQVELTDIEIRANLINSDRYCSIKQIIQELHLEGYSFMLSLDVILFPVIIVRLRV